MSVRVLFVCSDNSSRSIFAEALLNEMGKGDFEAYSAGWNPVAVHPLTVQVLRENGFDPSAFYSKTVKQFADLTFDYIIALCSDKNRCPALQVASAATTLCWNFTDPARASGTDEDRLAAFRRTVRELRQRLSLFIIVVRREPVAPVPRPILVA